MKNYLDFVPKINYNWEVKNGCVTVVMPHRGALNFLAQRLFKKPEKSLIELDEIGSFIWLLIDGKKSICEIAKLLDSRYEDKVFPLYERIIQFFKILKRNKFIYY